ncbi:MAG: hypothetical protein K2M48_06475 [Clostridiales bacterium]|nr:hypothetical protein [Clostridiales bacterium]
MEFARKIHSKEELLEAVNEYGILQFWSEEHLSAWTLSGVNFNTLWKIREDVVNSLEVVYGKYADKKATFVSREVFPYLAALRRDGYDFDSLSDEGRAPNRETLIMNAVADGTQPSYALGKSLGIKGFDAAVTSLQNKTYLCLTFKKSMMGTALLSKPETIFGYDYVRSKYSLSPAECAEEIKRRAAKGLTAFDEKTLKKLLSPAI